MQKLRSGRIHPIFLVVLILGIGAGVYVRYTAYLAEEKERISDEEAKKNPRRRGLGNAAEFARTNPAAKRKIPFKYLFSDIAPTRSAANISPVVEVEYSENPVSAKSYSENSREMMLQGVAHFRKANSFNKKAIVGETADLMEEIVVALHSGLGANLKKFRERLSPILIDPQVSGDPYFQYLAGLVHVETGETTAAEELFYGAAVDHTKYDYPSRYVVPLYNSSLENGLERVVHSKIHERFGDAIVCWLKYDFAESPSHHRNVWAILKKSIDLLDNDNKLDYVKKIIDLNEEEPFAPAWLSAMMAARYHTLLAQSAEEGSQDWSNNIDLAKKSLTSAMEINPYFPDPMLEMVYLADLSGDAEGSEHWVNQAREKGFDDYAILKTMIETCDTAESMMAFGKSCADSGKYDTIIPFALVGAYQRSQQEVTDPELVREVVRCLGSLADDLTPKYVGRKKVAPEWFRSAQAVIAAKNGDHQVASSAFDAVGDDFVLSVVDAFPGIGSLAKARARADAYSLLPADAVTRIEGLYEQMRDGKDVTTEFEKAIEEVGQVSAEVADSSFLARAKIFTETNKSYAVGDETQLQFGDMVLWDSPVESQVKTDSPTSLEISTLGGEDHAVVMSSYYTPGPKTIEVDLEFLGKTNPCDAEIIFGGWRGYGVSGVIVINGPGKRVGFGSTAFDGNIARFQFNDDREIMKVRANIADGFAEIFINDQLIVRSTSSRIQADSKVGLGLNGYGEMRSKIKFSNLQVTKWDAVPPLGDAQALVAHYQEETKDHPSDGYGWLFLGLAELEVAGADDELLSAAQLHILKSVALGVPELQAAPYLGDIADRKGDRVSAQQQYSIAFDELENVPVEILQTEASEQTYDRFQVAAARFLWNEMSDPERDLEARSAFVQKYDDQSKLNTPIGSGAIWIDQRLSALVRSTDAMAETAELAEAKIAFEEADQILEALKVREGFDDSGDAKQDSKADEEDEDAKEKSPALLTAEVEVRSAKSKVDGLERSVKRHQQAALRAIDSAIKGSSLDTVDELEALKTAIEAKSLFNRNSTDSPNYLDADGLTTFPVLRDYLRSEWQEFYK